MEDDSTNEDDEEVDMADDGKSSAEIDAFDGDENRVYSLDDREMNALPCRNNVISASSFALGDDFSPAASADKATHGSAASTNNMLASAKDSPNLAYSEGWCIKLSCFTHLIKF